MISSASGPACLVADGVLVTGATGLIGRALVARLAAERRELIALGSEHGHIARASTLAAYRSRKLDFVVHLAARSYVPDSWKDPEGFIETNVRGTVNVLEFCRDRQVPMIFASAYIYGRVDRQPINEEVTANPSNPYAKSKYLAECECMSWSREHGFPVTVLRPFNVFGPNQQERFLIPTIIRQVVERKTIEVLDLSPRRDWIFVEDVVDAIFAAARKPTGYRTYNIGSGASVSVSELVQRIQEVAGTRLPVRSRAQPREQEIPDTVADIGKARRELGWSPRTPLSEGLRRCIEAMDKR